MGKARGLVCAAALLLAAVAGCKNVDFDLSFFGASADGGQVITGSVNEVSLSFTAALRRAGLQVTAQQEREGVRLVSSTRTGKRFAIVLTKEMQGQVEQTRVRAEWTDGKDDQLWFDVMQQVVAAHAQ